MPIGNTSEWIHSNLIYYIPLEVDYIYRQQDTFLLADAVRTVKKKLSPR
jgi:hypothetical protein